MPVERKIRPAFHEKGPERCRERCSSTVLYDKEGDDVKFRFGIDA